MLSLARSRGVHVICSETSVKVRPTIFTENTAPPSRRLDCASIILRPPKVIRTECHAIVWVPTQIYGGAHVMDYVCATHGAGNEAFDQTGNSPKVVQEGFPAQTKRKPVFQIMVYDAQSKLDCNM